MYAKNSQRSNKVAPTSLKSCKFCKFCKDAGKSEEEYTNHFLRESKDPNSRITCPTLLAIECRFCFKKGHTVSKCEKLAKYKNGQINKKIPDAPMKKKSGQVYALNQFDSLSEIGDSDNEEVSMGETVTTCIDCDTLATASSNSNSSTYADILARPAPVKVEIEVGSRLSILSCAVGRSWSNSTKLRLLRSWADYSDSDDE